MIRFPVLFVLSALALTACGTTERTVVVQPAPGSTVVVPSSGGAKVIAPGL